MIAFLNGILAGKTQDTAFIDVGGIGYAVGMAAGSLAKLPEMGERVQVHTHLYVREDAISLFGFLSVEEKNLFLRLNSVSGVGPKVALSALSVFSPQQLVAAITSQDVALVSKIPGVGKKTASRIILELKGSLDADLLGAAAGAAPVGAGSVLQGVADALLSMGFTSAEIEIALKGAPEDADEPVLLQYALKRLGE
ncbi:Holliday junction branch migration protein RuvA [Raoultibacter timonensis]|uniref:Holliday junction branch migration complex subunit RuvA n=1 Tax=Raoultibacter timonensis TaxID=1907662 RepID=A0ABM7WHL3_9ACTN|nr:Holliday junction branch migration protein RuvA [Raoultibacter timonensis]BDE95756.1 Holliday junction ATP-dependent DNA helicase RuvA [Raoultibacter timonensis]BDF50360.1 Holliday junction ATP-dependent DNA helicase RuvA [Raoultibacter timonensis]